MLRAAAMWAALEETRAPAATSLALAGRLLRRCASALEDGGRQGARGNVLNLAEGRVAGG